MSFLDPKFVAIAPRPVERWRIFEEKRILFLTMTEHYQIRHLTFPWYKRHMALTFKEKSSKTIEEVKTLG